MLPPRLSESCALGIDSVRGGDLSGGPVVGSVPANAGDVSSIPGPRTKMLHFMRQLSPCSATKEDTAVRSPRPTTRE